MPPGVLLLITLLTFIHDIHKKLDSPVSGSAFELTLVGTLALLNKAQRRWMTWSSNLNGMGPKSNNFHLFLVQRGQAVKDQLFESYAPFANNLTSHPVTSYYPDADTENFPRDDIAREYLRTGSTGIHALATKTAKMQKKRRIQAEDYRTSKSTELLVLLATRTSMSGFILQFIGLRGMYWLATVAAVALMTALRTWVRRDLAGQPFTKKTPKGFRVGLVGY